MTTVKDLSIALIGGAGFMGKAHSLAYALADIEQSLGIHVRKAVLVEMEEATASRVAAEFGWDEWSTDWREVMKRDDIDIVDICTPPNTHAEIALAAMAAGKHVLSEKPISTDSQSAAQMWETAQATGVTNQVGFNYRNGAALRFAKALVSSGRIGEPLQLRIQYLQDCGFGDMGWRNSTRTGGSGALGDVGSHIIDMAQYLLGDILRVSGNLITHRQTADSEHDVDDAGMFIAEFSGGAIGSFAFSQQAWGQKNRISFELDGTDGALAFDWNSRDELEVFLSESEAEIEGFRRVHLGGAHDGVWFGLPGLGTGYLESSANQIISFLDAISHGTGAHPNFGEAAAVQRVVEAVIESSEQHNWVVIPTRDSKEKM